MCCDIIIIILFVSLDPHIALNSFKTFVMGFEHFVWFRQSYLECLHLDNFSFIQIIVVNSQVIVYASFMSFIFIILHFSFKPHFILAESFPSETIIFTLIDFILE